ncbi:MAG: DUF4238 domain-containing protein [Elusimicrobiota bacterium]
MPENKRQHYVPQLYLKQFSKDKKNITIFSTKEKKIVTTNGPIDRQCFENYMYGEDLSYEESLSQIEGATKKIFENIVLTNNIPSKKDADYFTLLVFILYQSARTLYAAEQVDEVIDKTVKTIIKEDIKIRKPEGITLNDIEKVKIGIKTPGLYNLGIVSQIVPLLMDLECKLIVNNTSSEFITSDNPVVRYNKYYLKEIQSYSGFACKGLLILFPISPLYYLVYFDPMMYEIGSGKIQEQSFQLDNNDVDGLNILQLINAKSAVYTLNENELYMKELFAVAEGFRNRKVSIKKLKNVDQADEDKSVLIWTRYPSIEYNANLSFIKIREDIPDYYLRQNLVRDHEKLFLHKEFCKKVEQKEYKFSQWNRFLTDIQIKDIIREMYTNHLRITRTMR